MRINSAVFYDGPSQLNGVAIVGVLTGFAYRSENTKTGHLLQAYILVKDQRPNDAIATGEDAAVCGDCALRGEGTIGRGCYVTYWQAPLRIWLALGKMPRVSPRRLAFKLRGRKVRLGAYGDPVAIPAATWTALLRHCAGAIGYTQRWPTCDDAYRGFLMASVLSTVDQPAAVAKGWRTYRLRGPRDELLAGECVCPASSEADHKVTCEDCMLCDGADSTRRANPVIMAHGKPGNLKALGINPLRVHRV